MEQSIMPFEYNGNAIRIVLRSGETWFVAKDVCDVLELTDASKSLLRLDDDEKGTNSIRTLGGEQEMLIVSESGLYNLIFTSKKPEARAFRKWVTSVVLPSIRRTGSYAIGAAQPAAQGEITRLTNELLTLQREHIAMQRNLINAAHSKPKRTHRIITDDEKDVIAHMHKQGASIAGICQAIRRGRAAVYYQIAMMNAQKSDNQEAPATEDVARKNAQEAL